MSPVTAGPGGLTLQMPCCGRVLVLRHAMFEVTVPGEQPLIDASEVTGAAMLHIRTCRR